MDQITERINELNKLIIKEQKEYNKDYKDITYITETLINIKIYIKKLTNIKNNKYAIKYGHLYEAIRLTINLITMFLNLATLIIGLAFIPGSTTLKITSIIVSVIIELIASKYCLDKTENNLEEYYSIFRNKKVSLEYINNEINYSNDKYNKLENEMFEQKEKTKKINEKIQEINELKKQLEIVKENIIQKTLEEKPLNDLLQEDTKILLKKYPQKI